MQEAAALSPIEKDPTVSPSGGRLLTDDPYRHARLLSGWRREVVQLSPGSFLGRVAEDGGGGFFAADEFMSRSLFHIGPAYRGGLTLGVVHSRGGEMAIWNGHRVGADTVLCVPGDSEMVLRSYENSRIRWLFVPWKMLAGDCLAGFRLAALKEGAALCLSHGELAARLRVSVRVVRQSSMTALPRGVLARAALEAFQDELTEIAQDFMSTYLVVNPRLGAREVHALRILRLVRAYLRENVGESIGLPDLCEAASTSERTIRNACEIVTGESPMTFLRAMRLNQVRRVLLHATSPVRITEIGMRWGFLHMPQFSKDYRILFGELPSETIRRQLSVASASG